jgi:hypothetical protein
MRRRLGAVARLLAVAFCVAFLCYIAARLVLAYQIRRGSHIVEEVQRVKVGDSEDSLSTLLKRFDGYRWDAQLGSHEDYNYVLEINPWRFPTLQDAKSGGREHVLGSAWNSRFRRAIGLRQWLVTSEIAVKKRQVVAVQSDVVVEGKTMWLGTSWRLSEKPREFERDPNVDYLEWPVKPDLDFVSPTFLEMGTGGGSSWRFWIEPSLPTVQLQVAKRWDFGCLDSFRGCDSLCDLLPEAARFFNQHSELAPKGGDGTKTLGAVQSTTHVKVSTSNPNSATYFENDVHRNYPTTQAPKGCRFSLRSRQNPSRSRTSAAPSPIATTGSLQ